MSRYEVLLFLHLLGAFAIFSALLATTALAFGWPPDEVEAPTRRRLSMLAARLFDVGGLVVLVFGIWLALDIDGYSLFDLWILAAIVLWVMVAALGRRARDTVGEASFARWHWLRAAVVVLLLADMIFKPGA